jgi:hypothetical protein
VTSPDSKRLARARRLYVMNYPGGSPGGSPEQRGEPVWSPDGQSSPS